MSTYQYNNSATAVMSTSASEGNRGCYGIIGQRLLRLKYKSGWTFAVENDTNIVTVSVSAVISPTLLIRVWVTDSRSGPDFFLVHRFEVPWDVIGDEGKFFAFIDRCIELVERHERREFYTIDGKRFVDPHRDGNSRLYE